MTQETKNESQNEYNFLVYEYHTWGSYGQHMKVLKFLVDVENKSQKPLWEVVSVKWEISDSRKNKHRKAYAKEEDILTMKGKIIKEITDYQSSGRREITAKYYIISDDLQEIKAETGVKLEGKYYDILYLHNKKILVSKDEVIVQ